jgi:hypothetical protein
VRLTATDVNGTSTSTTVNVQVRGLAKIGIFTLSFTDLAIPVSGIPITITRTYDSRVKTKRDFGVGWSLDVARGSFESNRAPGDGWNLSTSPLPFSFACQVVDETKKHLTTVRLSDREFYSFNLEFSNNAGLVGGCVADVDFVQVDGIEPGATLTIIGDNTVFSPAGTDQLLDFTTNLPFNPTEVELVTPDGRTVDLDRSAGGITRLADLNGNSISITASGIISSTGFVGSVNDERA